MMTTDDFVSFMDVLKDLEMNQITAIMEKDPTFWYKSAQLEKQKNDSGRPAIMRDECTFKEAVVEENLLPYYN